MKSILGAVNIFEGLSAELLAVDASDREALAQIAVSLTSATKLLEPDSSQILLARLAQQNLQQIIDNKMSGPAATLVQLADALVSITRNLQNEDKSNTNSIDAAIDSMQQLQSTMPPDSMEPVPSTTPEELMPNTQEFLGSEADAMQIEFNQELMQGFVVEALDHVAAAESSLLLLEKEPDDLEQIDTVLRAFHTIKGASSFLNLDKVNKLAHLSEDLLTRARNGEIRLTGQCTDLALNSCDSLRKMIVNLPEPESALPSQQPQDFEELLRKLSDPKLFSEQTKVSDCQDTDSLGFDVEATESTSGSGESTSADRQPADEEPEKAVAVVPSHSSPHHEANTVRVSTKRLDDLVDLVGELTIAQSMISQNPEILNNKSRKFIRSLSHAGKIVRELQDLAMSLRMVPLKGTFAKMNRLARDQARKSAKSVRLVTSGETTEIDRNMVEILTDPLIHMIRNAIDHGIESKEQRIQQGKEPCGTISLRAYHSVGNVVIEIQDDGKGLDTQGILTKARESQTLAPSPETTDKQAYSLIFQPGFSTAEKITEVSGRGVGLDVVRKNIAKLHGRVQVLSEPGQGTTFRLYLPLTTAIADAILVRVGSKRFLLPTMAIERSFCPQPGSISRVAQDGEIVMFRDELLPLFRLHKLFDIDDAATDPLGALLVVFCGGGKRCALMVDELLDHQQVVIKPLDKVSESVSGASGGAILGDGRVALILDADGLVNLAFGQSLEYPIAAVGS